MNVRDLYQRIFDEAAALVRQAGTDDVALARGIVAVMHGKPVPDWAQAAPQSLYRLTWLLHVREPAYDFAGLVSMALAVASMESGVCSLAETRDTVMMTVDQPQAYLAMEADRVLNSVEHSANVDIFDIDAVEDLSALVVVPVAQLNGRDGDGELHDVLARCSDQIRELLAGRPNLAPERLLQRARAVGAKGRLDEAIGYCEQVIDATLDGPVAMAAEVAAVALLFDARADDEAAERIEQALEDHEHGTGDLYFWRGRLARERGDWKQALADFEEALRQHPVDSTAVVLQLANVHAALGDPADAIAALTEALGDTPDDARLIAQRAHYHSHFGNHAAAIADADRAMRCEPRNLDHLHDRGVFHLVAEQNTSALTDLNAVLAIDSGHSMALQNRGVVYQRLGQLEKAEADFDQSYELDDRRLTALHGRAKVRVEQGKHDQALADLNTFLHKVPGELPAYLLRAQCHEATGRAAIAVGDYVMILRHSPKVDENTKAAEQALARLEYQGPRTYPLPTNPHAAAVAESGPPEARALLNEAVSLIASDPEQAIARLNELVDDYPKFFPGHLNRGMLYIQHNMLDQGEADLHNAAKFGPKTDTYHLAWGELFSKRGQAEKAVHALTQAIEAFDNDPETYLRRAIQLQKLDRAPEALADLERGLALSPADADILFTMAGTYGLCMGDYKSALATYDRLLQLFPSDAQTRANRGVTKKVLGDEAGALADWTEAIECDPFYALPYFQRGLLRFVAHDGDDAVMWQAFVDLGTALLVAPQGWQQNDAAVNMFDELRAQLSQAPQHPHALLDNAVRLAKSYRTEDIQVAEQLVVEMTNVAPKVSTFVAHCGELARQRNDIEHAREMFDKALALNADDADAHWGLAESGTAPQQSLPHLVAAKKYRHKNAHWSLGSLLDRLTDAYKRQGDKAQQRAMLEEWVEVDPHRDETWFALGFVLDEVGEVKRSIDAYTRALELNSHHYLYWYNRACEYARDHNTDAALKDLERAIQEVEASSIWAADASARVRQDAATEEYFDSIRQHPEFIRLLEA